MEVPRSVAHAIRLDKANNNTIWQDAMANEVKALQGMLCFEFCEHSPLSAPPICPHKQYQAHVEPTYTMTEYETTFYESHV